MTVTTADTIELNGYKYKIKGPVTGGWLDPFPDQISIGGADYDNRRNLSSWIMNDLRGGIGVEEMDEKVDANRCWWTNCIIKYRNHILPPRLAVELKKAPTPSSVSATGWDDAGAIVNAYDESTLTYAQNNVAGAAWGDYYEFTYTAHNCANIRLWVDRENANITKYDLDAYYAAAWHDVAEEAADAWGGWTTEALGATYSVTKVRIRFWNNVGASTDYARIYNLHTDGVVLTSVGATTHSANFNSKLYFSIGANLWRLNDGRDGALLIATLPATITALVPSLNSRLYIYMGDTTNYQYMSTAEAFTSTAGAGLTDLTADATTDTTTVVDAALSGKSIVPGDYVYNTTRTAGAIVKSFSGTTILLESAIAAQASGDTYSVRKGGTWGIQYDAKLFRANSAGTVSYSTDPDGAAPTWTTAGSVTDIASQIQGFVIGRDAAGAYELYIPTKSILKAYDSATPQWVDTEAVLPNHPIGGEGHAYWNGKLYLSYGLGIKEYYPETGSYLDIGLTERDGLPVEYNGEVTKLLGDSGVKGMFASIDTSVTSGNSKSGLYVFDGYGWQCWWVDTSNNGAMNDIIVSSASSGYAVYWDSGGSIYYIDIPRGIENPDKISQSYGTAGIFISPWFDAGNPVAAKLAKVLEDFAKGITATETVALKYRIDHTNTDLDTGWTTMDTLNTTAESGHNEELFASGAGISYKAIQFRMDFVTPGATAKPDIQSLVLYFKKRTGSEKLRVWNVTVICDTGGSPLTSTKQKVANLKAAVISTTDVLFSYHPNDDSLESFYVTVDCPQFSEQTGRDYDANYNLVLTES